MAEVLEMIWGARKPIYFSGEGWTTQITLRSHNKSSCARMRPYGWYGPDRP
jgi:hypothetical protein